MTPDASTLTTEASNPPQHTMLVAWGHFARTLGFTKRLARLPIDQKAVIRAPHEKIAEFAIGLLSGIEYLSDLSEGPAPLAREADVAQAWQLQPMADASGVSRTLAACTPDTVAALRTVLDDMGQPFLARAVSHLRQRGETLVLDADLTGRPVSSTSQTFPRAEFGYMDGEIRLGYQWAEICLQTRLFGRQWLSANIIRVIRCPHPACWTWSKRLSDAWAATRTGELSCWPNGSQPSRRPLPRYRSA